MNKTSGTSKNAADKLVKNIRRKTFVLVTHGIQEAIFLGSHCAVLTAGPARMADHFKVDIPHPRNLDVKTSEEFGGYVRRVYGQLNMD